MVRLGLLVIALAACSSPAAARPAWPRATPREIDGGESLAPRAAARAIAAAVEDDRPSERPAADKPAAPAASTGSASPGDKPAAVLPAAAPSDEPITTEEIVIEVED